MERTPSLNLPALVLISTAWGSNGGGINALNFHLVDALRAVHGGRTILVVYNLDLDDCDKDTEDTVFVKEAPAGHLFICDRLRSLLHGASICWIGHDIHTGEVALACARQMGGKTAIIHHMDFDSYLYLKPESKDVVRRIQLQKEILRAADIVVAVGVKLALCAKVE